MQSFLSTDELNIVKNEDEFSYSIEFKYPSRALIYSITKTALIQGGTITDNYKTFTFKAITIQTLKEIQDSLIERNGTKMFPYELSLKMILSLSTQLKFFLTKSKICFFKYDPKNIIVIDGVFLYLSNEDLVKREEEELHITSPFSKNNKDYISPELFNVKTIPERINYRTIYYSLGLLVVDNILEMCDYSGMENVIKEKILEKTIGKSKLYYFLLSFLDRNPMNICFIYI